MLCHSVFSVFSPEALSVHPSSVAMEKRQNGVPLAVYFISGSRPSRPTRITLLIDFPIRFSQGKLPLLHRHLLKVSGRKRSFLRAGTFLHDRLVCASGLGSLFQLSVGLAFSVKGDTLFITRGMLCHALIELRLRCLVFLLGEQRVADVELRKRGS